MWLWYELGRKVLGQTWQWRLVLAREAVLPPLPSDAWQLGRGQLWLRPGQPTGHTPSGDRFVYPALLVLRVTYSRTKS